MVFTTVCHLGESSDCFNDGPAADSTSFELCQMFRKVWDYKNTFIADNTSVLMMCLFSSHHHVHGSLITKSQTLLCSCFLSKSRQKEIWDSECFVQADEWQHFLMHRSGAFAYEWMGKSESCLHSRESRKGTALNVWCVDRNRKEIVDLFWWQASTSKRHPAFS